MTRLTIPALGLALFAAACGSKSPTTPSDTNKVTFTSQLLPSNEVPAVSNADASGTGSVTVVLNLSRDTAGAISGATADFSVNLSNFPANTTLTGAHIHHAAAGSTAGVLVNTGITSGEVVLGSGSGSVTKNGITVGGADAQDMITNPGNYYFNVHTTINTSGAARGQLSKQ